VLIEFVIAVAIFAIAGLTICQQISALHGALNDLRRESHLHMALSSAMAEVRARVPMLQPGEETDENGLTIRRSFVPLDLRNEKQVKIQGLSLMRIEAFYPNEPAVTVELYVPQA
jgi:type II secretory pathway pseudopilin PulG